MSRRLDNPYVDESRPATGRNSAGEPPEQSWMGAVGAGQSELIEEPRSTEVNRPVAPNEDIRGETAGSDTSCGTSQSPREEYGREVHIGSQRERVSSHCGCAPCRCMQPPSRRQPSLPEGDRAQDHACFSDSAKDGPLSWTADNNHEYEHQVEAINDLTNPVRATAKGNPKPKPLCFVAASPAPKYFVRNLYKDCTFGPSGLGKYGMRVWYEVVEGSRWAWQTFYYLSYLKFKASSTERLLWWSTPRTTNDFVHPASGKHGGNGTLEWYFGHYTSAKFDIIYKRIRDLCKMYKTGRSVRENNAPIQVTCDWSRFPDWNKLPADSGIKHDIQEGSGTTAASVILPPHPVFPGPGFPFGIRQIFLAPNYLKRDPSWTWVSLLHEWLHGAGAYHLCRPYCNGTGNCKASKGRACDYPHDPVLVSIAEYKNDDGIALAKNVNSYQMFIEALRNLTMSRKCCFPLYRPSEGGPGGSSGGGFPSPK